MPRKTTKRRRPNYPVGRKPQRWGDGPAFGYVLLFGLANLEAWFLSRPVDTVGKSFMDYIDRTPAAELLHRQNAVTSVLLVICGLGAAAFKAMAALCWKPLVETLPRSPRGQYVRR